MVMTILHVNSSCSSTSLVLGSNWLATQQKQLGSIGMSCYRNTVEPLIVTNHVLFMKSLQSLGRIPSCSNSQFLQSMFNTTAVKNELNFIHIV